MQWRGGCRDSVTRIVIRLRVRCSRKYGSFLGKGKIFLYSKSQTGSGVHPTSCSIHIWAPFPEVKLPGCEAHHFTSIDGLIISGSIPPLSYVSSWRVQKQLYISWVLYSADLKNFDDGCDAGLKTTRSRTECWQRCNLVTMSVLARQGLIHLLVSISD